MKKSEALVPAHKPMSRNDVTELVIEARLKKGLSWSKVAKIVGQRHSRHHGSAIVRAHLKDQTVFAARSQFTDS